MSTNADTKYLVICTPVAAAPDVITIEGCFASKDAALALVMELHENEGMPLEGFEVEGWRGRQYQGSWDHTGRLVENRRGEAVEGQ